MTRTGIERPDLWAAFFEGWGSRYKAYIHCTSYHTCASNLVVGGNRIGVVQVPTVSTIYCTNLVSAMDKLLEVAVPQSSFAGDKFIFVSESTLPVKPFASVYATLTKDVSSDFCVAPSGAWPRGAGFYIVKHSQWVVLNREHAAVVNRNWPQILAHWNGGTWEVPFLDPTSGELQGTGRMHGTRVCTDEWAIFASIVGALHFTHMLNDPNIHPSPLNPVTTQPQGICHTFAFWDVDSGQSEHDAVVQALQADFPNTKLSCQKGTNANGHALPDCDSSHPMAIEQLSDRGAWIFRQSPFLFARKFESWVMTLDQYKRHVLI
jgi:hypothetical protein